MDDLDALRHERDRLAEQSRAQMQFVAGLGHTLRTPLNAVLGFSDLLQQEASGPLTERQRRYVQRVHAAGRRQLELIDNLVNLARLTAGTLELRRDPCDLGAVTREVVGATRSEVEAKGMTVSIDGGDELPPVAADSELLGRALRQLLSNAVTHCPAGTSVHIALAPSRNGAESRVSITVEDDGEGIPVDRRDGLFDDFESPGGGASQRMKGAGIGLALVRRIVEAHGGDLTLEDPTGNTSGSRFVISIPVTAP